MLAREEELVDKFSRKLSAEHSLVPLLDKRAFHIGWHLIEQARPRSVAERQLVIDNLINTLWDSLYDFYPCRCGVAHQGWG
jgi:hypothetical protein